jgi:hypothetical protein
MHSTQALPIIEEGHYVSCPAMCFGVAYARSCFPQSWKTARVTGKVTDIVRTRWVVKSYRVAFVDEGINSEYLLRPRDVQFLSISEPESFSVRNYEDPPIDPNIEEDGDEWCSGSGYSENGTYLTLAR